MTCPHESEPAPVFESVVMSLFQFIRRLPQIYRNRNLVLQTLDDHTFFGRHPEESLWGSVTDREEDRLRALITQAERHPGPILEIGTLFGLTTQLLAACKSVDRQLITIDNYSWNPFSIPPEQHRTFTRRALRYCRLYSNVEIYEGSNTSFYREYQGERPAMVFIDALHTYEGVRMDIAWAVHNEIPIIAGHDYSPRWPGVQQAVDEFFGSDKQVFGSLWSHSQPTPLQSQPAHSPHSYQAASTLRVVHPDPSSD